MTDFITKDSGERQNFSSGARRDISTGKTRYDLIEREALKRWGDLMGRGADKYGEDNWRLGMPVRRFVESGLRHFFQYLDGDRTEDHLAAVLFNIGGIIHFEGTEWDDLNETPDPREAALQALVDQAEELNLYETTDVPYEQLSFDFSVEQAHNKHDRADEGRSYINWDSLTKAVDEGRADAEEIAWPEGHPYRKVDLRKTSEG